MAARSIIGCARPGCTGAARCAQAARPTISILARNCFHYCAFDGTGSIYHGGRSGHARRVVARGRGRPRTAGTSPPARCSQLTARTTGSTPGDTTIMNKQLIAAPLLLSLAGIAAAQSSVTLYGIVDAGVTYRSNERVGSAGAYTGHSSVGSRPATCPAAAGDQGFRGPRRRDARAVRPRERLRHHERHVAGRAASSAPGVRRPRQRPLRHGHARPPVHVARRLRGRSARRRILAASARTRATSTTSTRPRGSTARSSTRAPTTRASRSARCTASAASRAA